MCSLGKDSERAEKETISPVSAPQNVRRSRAHACGGRDINFLTSRDSGCTWWLRSPQFSLCWGLSRTSAPGAPWKPVVFCSIIPSGWTCASRPGLSLSQQEPAVREGCTPPLARGCTAVPQLVDTKHRVASSGSDAPMSAPCSQLGPSSWESTVCVGGDLSSAHPTGAMPGVGRCCCLFGPHSI